jgi:hypothetical protein
MSALPGLLTRVERATGPDLDLDVEIGVHVAGLKRTVRLGDPMLGNEREVPAHCPAYTGSVDAALALVKRAFPDFFWSIGFLDEEARTHDHHQHGALLFPHFHVADKRDGLGHGATPALALVAAVLAAKIAGGAPLENCRG